MSAAMHGEMLSTTDRLQRLETSLQSAEQELAEAQSSARMVGPLQDAIKSLKLAIAALRGETIAPDKSAQSNKYSRTRLPEAILSYLEEHRYSVSIQGELLPALLDGGAMTGKRKPEKPLRDSIHPLKPTMIAIQSLAKNGRIRWDKQAGTVEIRKLPTL